VTADFTRKFLFGARRAGEREEPQQVTSESVKHSDDGQRGELLHLDV
jgi:hypothetical protein